MLSRYVLAALALCLAPMGHASTRIYKYVDAEGVAHFTDMPDSRRYRLLDLSTLGVTRSGDQFDPRLLARATHYDVIIEAEARAAAIEPNLLRAVIVVESGFNPRALSKCGAAGLMQLMPATAARFGIHDRYNPALNIRAGARYLSFLLNRFDHNVRLALAAYNAGEDAVVRNAGEIPPYAETLEYIPKVLKVYQTLSSQP